MNFEKTKQDYLTETELRLREMELNVDKAVIEAEKQKKQIEENLESMKNAKEIFATEVDKLRNAAEAEWAEKVEAFEKKFNKEDVFDEVTEKAKEYAEKTKQFFAGFGSKVSDLYRKSVDEMKKTANEGPKTEDPKKE